MSGLLYGSVCSGIAGDHAAWNHLGWDCAFVSEIDPFCCALLDHRLPKIPNLGDMKDPNFLEAARAALHGRKLDVFAGGTPCQGFSVAGLGLSMEDMRSNLTLLFAEYVHELDPRLVVWENVPGILSRHDNPFGVFLGLLVGAGEPLVPGELDEQAPSRWWRRTDKAERGFAPRWPCAGMVAGPARTACWRILDAQHFGVPQRRGRVFVVSARAGDVNPAAILLEPEVVPRHHPQSEAARKKPARSPAASAGRGGFWRALTSAFEVGDDVVEEGTAATLNSGGNAGGFRTEPGEHLVAALTGDGVGTCGADDNQAQAGHLVAADAEQTLLAFGGNKGSGPRDVAAALNAHGGGARRQDFETETFVVEGDSAASTPDLPRLREGCGRAGKAAVMQCHGGNVGEMGTLRCGNANEGGGVPFLVHPLRGDGFDASEDGTGRGTPLVFSSKGDGGDVGDLAPTIRALPHDKSHPNAGGPPAVCYRTNAAGEVSPQGEGAAALTGSKDPAAQFIAFDGQNVRIQEGVAATLDGGAAKGTRGQHIAFDETQPTNKDNRSRPGPGEPSHPLAAGARPPALAFTERTRSDGRSLESQEDISYALTNPGSGGRTHSRQIVDTRSQVRRLTPRECERLQGFPDNWTFIPNYRASLSQQKITGDMVAEVAEYLGVPEAELLERGCAPDGPRYRSLGNAWATVVPRWIGGRIEAVLAAHEEA